MELPQSFRGYPVSWMPGRNGVLEIGAFYRKYLAVDGTPMTIGQWLNIPEHHLATAVSYTHLVWQHVNEELHPA